MYLAIIGYLIIAVMMIILLKGKASAALCFSTLPVIGALIAGFSFSEIFEFISKGMDSVWKTAILFIFSVCYFSIMNDTGLFDPLVRRLVSLASTNIIAIMIVTCLIAVVGHMDGACASTYLITIPVMLPIFQKMKLNKLDLLLIVGLSTGVMNLVPWGGPTIRAATAIQMDANQLWKSLIPLQIFGLIIALFIAVYIGIKSKKHLSGSNNHLYESIDDVELQQSSTSELKRPKMFIINLILTLIIIFLLCITKIAPYLIFLFGTMLAFLINFPNMKLQSQLLKKYSSNCIDLTVTLLCAGIFLGIFAHSGIINEMAKLLIFLSPHFLIKYLYIIMGILGGPLGIIMGPDPYYYAVMPIIIETVAPYGITPEQVARAMLIGENVVLSVSPCVAANYLALGLTNTELKDHMKHSFKWQWFVSILMLIFAMIIGVI